MQATDKSYIYENMNPSDKHGSSVTFFQLINTGKDMSLFQ